MPKQQPQPKTSSDYRRLAEKTKQPNVTVTEGSNHTKVERKWPEENRSMATYLPRHNGDLKLGTRKSIEKSFRLMGILQLLLITAGVIGLAFLLNAITRLL